MTHLRKFICKGENGQTLIFVAVMASLLMAITGVAVEGGHLFVEFRKMQSAADMAALVGAQKLPCGLTDPTYNTCIAQAVSQACDYAKSNGYGGGAGTGACLTGTKSTGFGMTTTSVSATAPPTSCSPYDFLDYGNNSSCPGRPTSVATQVQFLEVQIQEPVTVPIFNVSFTLSAHAVAKEGISSPTDFTVSVLDPITNPAFTMGGHTTTVVVGDTMSNGGIGLSGSAGTEVSCDGSWFTAASQTDPGLQSNLSGAPDFAPVACAGGTTQSNPSSFFPNSPAIPDPYGDTQPPSTTNMPNCPSCEGTAVYYTWQSNRTSGQWVSGASGVNLHPGDSVELFPGVYGGGLTGDHAGTTIYVNPGVYTFNGSWGGNAGVRMCIYGSPACDELGANIPGQSFNCANASFNAGDANVISPSKWYYFCSPWGVWDKLSSSLRALAVSQSVTPPPSTPPTYYDPTGTRTLPFNGVTFYMKSGDFTLNGHADMYLAFPNSCSGTDSNSGFTPGSSVTFHGNPIGEPSGVKNAYYTYPAGSLAQGDGLATSTNVTSGGTATQVYPDANLTLEGECKDGLFVWNGEFPNKPQSQHLHFLLFADNGLNGTTGSNFQLNGGAVENWWGIWHSFPQNYPGYPGAPTADCNGCNITLRGNGGGGGSIPMLEGQIVTGSATFSGNSNPEIFFRPCKALITPCGTGPGTALVQ